MKKLIFLCLAYVSCCLASVQEIPVGHLKPFGGHTPPSAAEERYDIPSAKEFWEKYVKPSRAVVFRGAGKKSPMFTKWTDEYLAETFGDLDLRVESKREEGESNIPVGDKGVGRDTIKYFLDHYKSSSRYAVSELPRPMFEDVMVPPCLSCGDFAEHLVEIDLWLSSFNSSSIVHKDAYNAINCLFNGTKQWKLIDYKYEDKIYQAKEDPPGLGGFSKVNADSVDLLKYPTIREVPWSYVDIEAGDCLFLPKSMYHQVTSVGEKNMAIAILFSRFDDEDQIDLSNCDQETTFTPLSKFDVDWEYPGYGMLSMGNTDLKARRQQLMEGLNSKGYLSARSLKSNMERPSKELFRKIIKTLLPENGNSIRNITADVIEKLTKEQLRKYSWFLEPVEPSNTYDHEYGIISSDQLQDEIENFIREHEQLDRESFVNMYNKKLFGTIRAGNKIFDDLGGKDKNIIKENELTSDFDHVFRKFADYARGGKFAEGEDGGDAYVSGRDGEVRDGRRSEEQQDKNNDIPDRDNNRNEL